jgi:phthalate 4,5-dioxygenase
MLTQEQNEFLTRTGPGTPMGELFRRYWIPALLEAEVRERDGPPVRVKLLGEKLIAFRDSEGRVGITACRSGSGATRSAGCAARTTAGSTT